LEGAVASSSNNTSTTSKCDVTPVDERKPRSQFPANVTPVS
jgi:hypothetical protein